MGLFSMVAKAGEKYYAVCTNEQDYEKRFELPEAVRNMYSISTETIKNNLYVSVLNYKSRQEVKHSLERRQNFNSKILANIKYI